ncbi:LrgB family protein [Paenibacillus sp. NPDC057967]|uniref:LrgB family protein n=1 Tax=Paenibacillus sp. NPDC057967 TaxID=3346293 RepID=UPI0036DC575F
MTLMNPILHSPVFGIALTISLYWGAIKLKARHRWVHPLMFTAAAIIAILLLSDIPYEDYRIGGEWLNWALVPATVALAVPLYKHASLIRSKLAPVMTGITLGAIVSAGMTAGIFYLTGASMELMFSAIAKSSSAPFSMEIARRIGGIPELAAAISVITGLFGSLAGPTFLRLCGVKSDIGIGAAIGTSSHGIGTARLMETSELQGSVSGFAMAAAGIISTLLMLLVYWWLLST